jgi:translocation and assembly module TamA
LVLASRLKIGAILGDVPVTERYYAGGASSHRGFSERRLSPTVDGTSNTAVIGGAGMIEDGAELRARFEPWGLHFGQAVFVDCGDVTERPAELQLFHQHCAAGVSLRYFLLPVGPFRLDFAYRLNRYGPGEPEAGQRFQWFIGFGEAY